MKKIVVTGGSGRLGQFVIRDCSRTVIRFSVSTECAA